MGRDEPGRLGGGIKGKRTVQTWRVNGYR
jgi:hypothetical protein